jgi:hypothetical protein
MFENLLVHNYTTFTKTGEEHGANNEFSAVAYDTLHKK